MKLQVKEARGAIEFSVAGLDLLFWKRGYDVSPQDADSLDVRLGLAEQLQQLAPDPRLRIDRIACDIPSGPGEAVSDASLDRVSRRQHDDGNRSRCALRSKCIGHCCRANEVRFVRHYSLRGFI